MTAVRRIVAGLLLCLPQSAWGHGMDAELIPSDGAVVLACAYANGDGADAELLVHSPAEPGRIYQRLRTDLRGVASFVPDVAGTWRVIADDGMGHRAELEIEVTDTGVFLPSGKRRAWLGPALAAIALVLAAWFLRRRREVAA